MAPLRTVRTMCPMNCHPTLCGMLVDLEDGRVVAVRGDPDNPDSRGFLCMRGHASREIIDNPHRVLHPLRRTARSGAWQRTTWEDALDTIAGRARAVGPALGGVVVAAVGSGTTFLLNAASFFGVILFLYRWQRPMEASATPRRVWSAIGDGFAYVRESSLAKSVLLRTGTFSVAAASMLALMPIIARPFGARGYGVLLGCFGLGALIGAALVTLLPELLRGLGHYRSLINGVILIVIILYSPKGIWDILQSAPRRARPTTAS